MTYSLSNNCTKNYYNRTLTVQVIVEDVVTWIFLKHSVYYDTGSLKKSYIVRSLYNCVILCITCRLCGACVCRILIKITYLLNPNAC